MERLRFATAQDLRKRIETEFIATQTIHPVVQAIADGRATMDQLRGFCKEMWAIPKYNFAVAGGKVSQLQPLIDDPHGTGVPYDEKIQKHFLHIVVDEAGTEIFGNAAPTSGHYELYLRFAEGLGIPREEMERVDIFLPQVVVALDSWVRMAREMPLIESAVGMNWINETRMSRMGILIEKALKKHYGLPERATEFWYAHGEQDKEHSSIGPYLVETYATTPEIQERVWMAAKRGVGIWLIILDATWAEYFSDAKRT